MQDAIERARTRLDIARELEETNPMLGTRGARLGLLLPGLYEMQVRAIVEAALEVSAEGDAPQVEIMLPLIAFESELGRAAASWSIGPFERGPRGRDGHSTWRSGR